MTLRPRLALSAIAMMIPIVAGMFVFDRWVRERAGEESLVDMVNDRMQSERAACEAQPEHWRGVGEARPWEHRHFGFAGPRSGRGFGMQLFAYDNEFHASAADAPALDPALIRDLEASHGEVSRRYEQSGEQGQEVLLRMPWKEGPCAVILARRMTPRWVGGPPVVPLALVLLAPLAAMVIALGPVVGRIRQLAAEVRGSARSGYRDSVLARSNDEIADLARAFAEASKEIRLQIDEKEQQQTALRTFLENTTHDVMIPLSVLQGHLAEMRVKTDAAIVGRAMNEAQHIAGLIGNLSLAARLEARQPDNHRLPVNLNALVGRVVSRFSTVAAQNGVALDSGVPEVALWTNGDVTLIEQAIGNIVDNAIRYNARANRTERGHVALALDESDKDFVIRVIDDGPGIAEDEIARIEERYVRGNAARTRAAGHGLGLSIARQVVRLHDWQMELRRSEYGGVEACIRGPIRPSDGQ